MGCCSLNFRKIVDEEERRGNSKGKENIPWYSN